MVHTIDLADVVYVDEPSFGPIETPHAVCLTDVYGGRVIHVGWFADRVGAIIFEAQVREMLGGWFAEAVGTATAKGEKLAGDDGGAT